jgi:hypothetical protein
MTIQLISKPAMAMTLTPKPAINFQGTQDFPAPKMRELIWRDWKQTALISSKNLLLYNLKSNSRKTVCPRIPLANMPTL